MTTEAKSLTAMSGGRQPTAVASNERTKYSAHVKHIMASPEGFSRNTDTQAKRKAGMGPHHVRLIFPGANPFRKYAYSAPDSFTSVPNSA